MPDCVELDQLKLDHIMQIGSRATPRPRTSFARYAIVFTPQPGTALAAFGRSWFGRINDGATLQAFSGESLARPGFAKLAAAPGRYNGLHVMFKAPFALRHGMGPDALRARLKDFAARRKPVETGPLVLAREGHRLVLRPVEERPMVDWLAAQCVSAFDGFAGALSTRERKERCAAHLSPYQRLLLESFGDCNVLSEFRFSITLTGPLEPAQIDQVANALWPVLEGICKDGIKIDGLSLLGDPGGRFPLRQLSRYPLRG